MIQMKSYIYDYHKENKIITITIFYNKKLYIINYKILKAKLWNKEKNIIKTC
jgi:hypothetical protein